MYRAFILAGTPLNSLSTNSQSLALREFLSQSTWDHVLKELRGVPVKMMPCIYIGWVFFSPPPKLTKSQALYNLNCPPLNFLSTRICNGPGT